MGNEDFLVSIKQVNNNTVQSVVNNDVPKKETESIFDDFQTSNNEDNLVAIEDVDEEDKNNISNIIKKTIDNISKMVEYNLLSKEDSKYTVNGEIDQDFKQGNVADCVLLANLYSLSRTQDGAAIIKDAIKINYDEGGATESYDVYFKGLDKTYNIPVEEYMEAERLRPQYQRGEVDEYYSAGDDDVLLMELAYKAAFDDINEAKRSNSLFAKTDALTSVDYEQFLYAFAGIEDVNSDFWIREEYRDMQAAQYMPIIKNVFETQEEFKLEDVCVSNCNIAGMTINSFGFDFEGTYVIEKKPSEFENDEITIKNKETGETLTCEAEYLAKSFARVLSGENEKQVGLDMYDLALESDFVYFGNSSHKPIDVVDVDGKNWTICQQHAYGIKEITQDYIVLVNPHNSEEEIKISRDEYLKYYKEIEGFKLFSANFEE